MFSYIFQIGCSLKIWGPQCRCGLYRIHNRTIICLFRSHDIMRVAKYASMEPPARQNERGTILTKDDLFGLCFVYWLPCTLNLMELAEARSDEIFGFRRGKNCCFFDFPVNPDGPKRLRIKHKRWNIVMHEVSWWFLVLWKVEH